MSTSLKLIAIETTQEIGSVALKIDDTLYEVIHPKPREHARALLPSVHQLLEKANLTLSDIDFLACSCGPGSFTGVRIGIAFIQGLSFGINKPVVLVSTLRAAAQAAFRLHHITHACATLDARMQEIYWGLYAVDHAEIMQPISKECLTSPDGIILPEGLWVKTTELPSARDVAEIAVSEYRVGHFVEASEVKPVYLRNEVAKKAGL